MAKNRLYGIGEPVWLRDSQGEIDGPQAVEIMDAIGFGSFREWMHLPWVLENPTTPKPEVVRRMTQILDKCAELDIEVTGMSHHWFLPEGCKHTSGGVSPDRDLSSGSLYMQMLEMLEQSWFTMVSQFPQVPMWEVGNEWNIFFLSRDDAKPLPNGMHGSTENFTLSQRADIAVDMMYFAAKGIRRANPNAKVVMFSPCPNQEDLPWFVPAGYGIALMMDMIYSRIRSGDFWSTETDDYFDVVAWHPYTTHDAPPDDVWKEINDAAYRVMQKYGDGHKKVLITEFGYTDSGDPEKEKRHAEYYQRIFAYMQQMPYIHAFHIFRLFEDARMSENWKPGMWGGPYEQYFGIFREPKNGLTPRTKAIEIQKLIGCKKDLWRFAAK